MPRLSRAQEQARHQIVQLAGRGLLPAPLGQRLLRILQGVIPADGQIVYSLDPATGWLNRVLASSRLEAAASWVLPHGALHAPGLCDRAPPTPMPPGGAVSVLGPPLSSAGRCPACHEGCALRGDRLHAMFSAQGAWVAALELVRGEASGPFQPTDETFLQLLAPTIGRLLCAALAQEHPGADGRAPGPDTAGILVLSPQGHVAVHTAAAERWLTLLRRGEESLASPVPLAVWSAVAQLRSAAADPAQAIVRVPTASGILRVEASRGHPDDLVAVALVPERRPVSPVPPATPALAALTPQEKRVLGLLLCGRSTREMAAALVVSVNTVETHLRHIYEKLAVPGRGALLARVLQDTDGLVSSCLC